MNSRINELLSLAEYSYFLSERILFGGAGEGFCFWPVKTNLGEYILKVSCPTGECVQN